MLQSVCLSPAAGGWGLLCSWICFGFVSINSCKAIQTVPVFQRRYCLLRKPFQAKRNITFFLAAVLAQAAITKCYPLGSFKKNPSHLFFTVLESGTSKIKVAAWLGSGESSFPGCLPTVCSLAFPWWREILVFPLSEGHSFHHEGPTLPTSSKRNYLPKVPSPNPITLGLKLQQVNLGWGHKRSAQKAPHCGNHGNVTPWALSPFLPAP